MDIVDMETIVVASRGQAYTELNDGVTILGLSDGVYYGLNSVGARIWNLIQEKRKVFDIFQCLLREYRVEAAVFDRDLLQLLNRMADHGLVEVIREGD
ncbi:MAG: PqqD family protein [Desulfomonilaceae bacterium]